MRKVLLFSPIPLLLLSAYFYFSDGSRSVPEQWKSFQTTQCSGSIISLPLQAPLERPLDNKPVITDSSPHYARNLKGWFMYYWQGADDKTWLPASNDYRKLSPGIYEVSQYPDSKPSAAQINRSNQLIKDTYEAAKRNGWFQKSKAMKDGYQPMLDGSSHHYPNLKFINDEHVLNPERPEFLMYYDSAEGPVLTGVMFYARTVSERGPQIGGPLTVWHFHVSHNPLCVTQSGLMAYFELDRTEQFCPPGLRPSRLSPEMLHVWFVDHPEGWFGTQMGARSLEVRHSKLEAL